MGARTLLKNRNSNDDDNKRKNTASPPPPTTSYTLAKTRDPIEARLPSSGIGASVTLRGDKLHDDVGAVSGDDRGVGMWMPYIPERDYGVSDHNITFCSFDDGSGLIEIGRYSPILPCDRKTDLTFTVKNFLFSSEPMSWRFDVPEKLNGYSQVVDFTDDITGDPHECARKEIAMYVNEVGGTHYSSNNNNKVEENVVSRHDRRSVSYYILRNEPMQRGETVELFVDYKEADEDIRKRNGYAKPNNKGANSVVGSFAQLQQNLKQRSEMESFIHSYKSKDLESLLKFLQDRILEGIATAISASNGSTSSPQDKSHAVLVRQWVARRRLNWMSLRLAIQLQEVSSRILGDTSPGGRRRTNVKKTTRKTEKFDRADETTLDAIFINNNHDEKSDSATFRVGMVVYVNGWAPPKSSRADYFGLGIIDSVSMNPGREWIYSVGLEGQRCIPRVPESVLTHPTEREFKELPERLFKSWVKWKETDEWPRKLRAMKQTLKRMSWDQSLTKDVLSLEDETGVLFDPSDENGLKSGGKNRSFIFDALNKEISEEYLFLLQKKRRILHPFHKGDWCPLSTLLLRKLLRQLTIFTLSNQEQATSREKLSKSIFNLATEASMTVRSVAERASRFSSGSPVGIESLVFKRVDDLMDAMDYEDDDSDSYVMATKEDDNDDENRTGVERPVEEVQLGDAWIHVRWYLYCQVIVVVHSLASLVRWDVPSTRTPADKSSYDSDGNGPSFYTLEKLCDTVGVEASDAIRFLEKSPYWSLR